MNQDYPTTDVLNVGNILNQAWELTKKHFPLFLALMILSQLIATLPNMTYYGDYMNALIDTNGEISEEQWLMLQNKGDIYRIIATFILAYIVAFLGGNFLSMVNLRMLQDAIDGKKLDLTDLLKTSYGYFWFFIGIYIAFSFAILLASLCFIIPGIYLGIRWMFVVQIAATRRDLTFREVFTRSWNMTKGNFWTLLFLCLVMCAINVIGLACCCVGILVTSIISLMMYGLAYKALSQESKEEDVL